MPIGNTDLADVAEFQVHSMPGMAHFAGSGPDGKFCNDCKFFNTVGRIVVSHYCLKYQQMMKRKSSPEIHSGLKSCKYFEDKPRKAQGLRMSDLSCA